MHYRAVALSMLFVFPLHSESSEPNVRTKLTGQWEKIKIVSKDFCMELSTCFTAHIVRDLLLESKPANVSAHVWQPSLFSIAVFLPLYIHENNSLGVFGHAAVAIIGFMIAEATKDNLRIKLIK